MSARARSGFTLVEAVVSTFIFTGIMGLFLRSLYSAQQAQDGIESAERLDRGALDVAKAVRGELSRSGYEPDFPAVYDGDIGTDHADFAHSLAHDRNSEPVLACDVAYRLPADADQDGWPDVDEEGNVFWEDDPRAFVLVPDGSGSNELVHFGAEGRRSTVARDVESIAFSRPAESQYAIPLDCMGVRVVLREGRGGLAQQRELSFVVKLRNGGLSE